MLAFLLLFALAFAYPRFYNPYQINFNHPMGFYGMQKCMDNDYCKFAYWHNIYNRHASQAVSAASSAAGAAAAAASTGGLANMMPMFGGLPVGFNPMAYGMDP